MLVVAALAAAAVVAVAVARGAAASCDIVIDQVQTAKITQSAAPSHCYQNTEGEVSKTLSIFVVPCVGEMDIQLARSALNMPVSRKTWDGAGTSHLRVAASAPLKADETYTFGLTAKSQQQRGGETLWADYVWVATFDDGWLDKTLPKVGQLTPAITGRPRQRSVDLTFTKGDGAQAGDVYEVWVNHGPVQEHTTACGIDQYFTLDTEATAAIAADGDSQFKVSLLWQDGVSSGFQVAIRLGRQSGGRTWYRLYPILKVGEGGKEGNPVPAAAPSGSAAGNNGNSSGAAATAAAAGAAALAVALALAAAFA